MSAASPRRGHRRHGGAAVLVGVGVAVGMLLGGAQPAEAYDEDVIIGLVNQARWDDGQRGLNRNAAMDQVALGWAQQLAAAGTLSHNPDYSTQIPAGWTGAAENVAQGYPSGASVHAGWMDSPGHRANILGDYTDIGIALIEAGGTTWAVEVFGRYPGSVGPAAPVVEPAPAPAPSEPLSATPAAATPAAPPPAATPVPRPSSLVPSTAPTSVPTAGASGTARSGSDPSAGEAPPIARQAPVTALTAENGAPELAAPILLVIVVAMTLAVAAPFVPVLMRWRRERGDRI